MVLHLLIFLVYYIVGACNTNVILGWLLTLQTNMDALASFLPQSINNWPDIEDPGELRGFHPPCELFLSEDIIEVEELSSEARWDLIGGAGTGGKYQTVGLHLENLYLVPVDTLGLPEGDLDCEVEHARDDLGYHFGIHARYYFGGAGRGARLPVKQCY